MSRCPPLRKIARYASSLDCSDRCVLLSSRLLSHSQASTSAASDSACLSYQADRKPWPHQWQRASQASWLGWLCHGRTHARGFSSEPPSRDRDVSGTPTGQHGRMPPHPRRGQQTATPLDAAVSSPQQTSATGQAELAEGLNRSTDQPEQAEDESDLEFGHVEDGQFPYAASQVDVINLAGSTDTTWEFLGGIDEEAIVWYGIDFTRGTCPEVERNALLSNEAKEMIYQMHKHDSIR